MLRRVLGLTGATLLFVVFACGGGSSDDAPSGGASSGSPGSADASTEGGVTLDGGASADGGESAPAPVCPAGSEGPGAAPLGSVPGALTFPSPTLRNVAVEWALTGDEDADSIAELRYRKQGDTSWKKGLPLRRVPAGSVEGFSWANRHAGSIFDLEPDTTYEVEAFLLDPDGGCVIQSGTVKTRPVPAPMPNAPVKAATPATFASVANAAKPGDVIELGAGTYAAFSFPRDGQLGKPIVVRAAGAVTVTGDVSLISRKYVHLVGLTVEGRVRVNATTGVAVMNNTVNTNSDGIIAGLRSEDLYIADNVVTGATNWTVASLGVGGDNVGEGIVVTGPGHVIEHNRVRGFRDCISLFEESEAVDQFSIDIVENDLEVCSDDGIEADFCAHDCRIVRNRLTNVFMAMSSQPGLGGPTYFIRNVAYNVVLSTFKLQRGSIGDVLLHNTSIKSGDAFGIYTDVAFSRQYARNNLFIGGPGGTFNSYANGDGKVLALEAAEDGDFDYDGYGSTTGAFTGRIGAASFTSLADLQSKTTEKHAVAVGLDAFAASVAHPANPFPAYTAPSLELASGSKARDVGAPLPNVNDGFGGAGPDLGAYELGQPVPAYGPR